MDGASIGITISSLVVVGGLLAGWIWDTRNNVGRLESTFNKEIGETKEILRKELSEVKEELERQGTMIEPFWNTLCENLPAILKMHNSPDPLAACLEGQPTLEEIDALISRIKDDLKIAMTKDDPKVYGYIMALAMATSKRQWILKQGDKNGRK